MPRLSRATRETYRTAIRHTLVDFAKRDAHHLTGADVYRWSSEQVRAGASTRKVNKAITALSSAYQRGVEWGIVESNPVRGVKRLPEDRGLPLIPTPGDVDWLMLAAPTERDRLMLRVAFLTGIRQGELFALEWKHVHDDHMAIVQALDRDASLKQTKTGKARRVPLPPKLAADLESLRPAHRRGLVFASSVKGPMSRSNFARRAWGPWRRNAAWQAAVAGEDWHRLVTLKWQHLRHHYASRCASRGASMLQVSRWMGHGTIRTTMDRYGFLWPEDESVVMRALED